MSNILLLSRTKDINAILDLPGSKSIANRVLLLAAVANGTSIIHNVPDISEDVRLMLEALAHLGVSIKKIVSDKKTGASTYEIIGCGGKFGVKEADVFCGNSGTTIRFLGAMLALMRGEYRLTGIQRMKERPIEDLILALNQIGAKIQYLEKDGFPPFKTDEYIDNNIDTINLSGKLSSQYLTGLLMALPLLKRKISIKIIDELISKPYVDITIVLLKKFGVHVDCQNGIYTINANSKLKGIEYTIEPDASSASYFLALGALNGQVQINNLSLSSLQGDKYFASVLEQMGARVSYASNSIMVSSTHDLQAININMQSMPDVAMTIAVMALFAKGTSTITGISSWKLKETDRLLAMYKELTKLGAAVSITDDSIKIIPPHEIKSNIAIDTYNDHRMVMCFSLIAAAGTKIILNDYECVGKTFANYFDLFNAICY